MTFCIITRTHKTDTIQIIKDDIKRVFQKAGKDNYVHCIICDLTGGVSEEQFEKFADEKTELYYVDKESKVPKDTFCAYSIDVLARNLEKQHKDYWIYILDHDNLLKDNFPDLQQYCDEKTPILMFDIETPRVSQDFDGKIYKPFKYKEAIFHVNSANYLTHISVFEKCGHGNNVYSGWHDGFFIQKALYNKIPIKYLSGYYGYHNAIKQHLKEIK